VLRKDAVDEHGRARRASPSLTLDDTMPLSIENAIGQKLMLGFHGMQPPSEVLEILKSHHVGGATLFRSMNLEHPAQIRELTDTLQRAARESNQPPLLLGVDQEGGTLMAVPGTSRFPGNLALGAARSTELAYRTGLAIGRELAALGINVNYAPVCDVNNNPHNPVVGPRSFGSDPQVVAQLAAAVIDGLQAAGVAATAKHFPGHGDVSSDPHYSMAAIVPHDEDRLRSIEFVPFKAAIRSGVKLIMTAHIALPEFDRGYDRPATLSPRILTELLRDEWKYPGVIISDALDMHAILQGTLNPLEAVCGAAAGLDLLLMTAFVDQAAIYEGLCHAARRGLLTHDALLASVQRILALKEWVSQQTQPSLDVVGCAEHAALVTEIAERSITLVRDEAQLLPLHLKSDDRIAVIVPQPQDLTPADTSSYDKPALAEAMRAQHGHVDEVVIPIDPGEAEVAALVDRVAGAALVIVGTINANQHPGQAALINTLIDRGQPIIAIALRMPYDVSAYPRVPTYVCAYSLQRPSLQAVAQALWGKLPFRGYLPVELPEA
jgi:beta-N-acetylhexosaminidase